MRNAVLYCTSPLQVINFKAAIDYLESRDQIARALYIVIAHGACTARTKQMIRHLSRQIACKGVIDLSHVAADASIGIDHDFSNRLLSEQGRTFFSRFRTLKVLSKKRVQCYQESLAEIVRVLNKEVGEVHEVFFRASYKTTDGIFLTASQEISTAYLIEDGHGEYLPRFWSYRTLNLHNIAHAWRHRARAWPAVLLSGALTGAFDISRNIYFRPHRNWVIRFTNLPRGGHTDIGSLFTQNVAKLYNYELAHATRKVIIFGTRVVHPKYRICRVREVEIYNQVIEWIRKEHGVDYSEIWYKPHPRCPMEDWQFKTESMACRVWDMNENTLGEIELLNPSLKAVYSFGSTSLIYAQVLFGKKAGIIDIRKEGVHPTWFEISNTVAQRFKIEAIPNVW